MDCISPSLAKTLGHRGLHFSHQQRTVYLFHLQGQQDTEENTTHTIKELYISFIRQDTRTQRTMLLTPTEDCIFPSLAKTLYSSNTCDKRDLNSLMTLGLSCLSLLTDWQISSTMGEIESRHNLFASQ